MGIRRSNWIELPKEIKCKKCNARTVYYRIVESGDGAYDDEEYMCTTCNHNWWIDGIDS